MGSKDACLLFLKETCFPSSKTLHFTNVVEKLSRTVAVTVSAHKICRNVGDPQTVVSQQYPGQCLVKELRLFFIQKHRLRKTDLSSCNQVETLSSILLKLVLGKTRINKWKVTKVGF